MKRNWFVFVFLLFLLPGMVSRAQSAGRTGEPLPETGKACLPADSSGWKLYAMQGERYEEQGRLRQSLACYLRALEQHVSDTLVHAAAGCYYQRGYYRECIRVYHTYLENDSSDNRFDLTAKCYDKMEYPDSALAFRKKIAARNIENPQNLTALVQNYLTLEYPDSALHYLQRYMEADSTNLNVNRLYGYVSYLTGNYEDAVAIYRTLKKDGDDQLSTNYYLGLSYARTDSLSQAYDCLAEAVRRSERANPYILSQCGVVSVEIGMIKEGMKDIEEALELLQPDRKLVANLYDVLGKGCMQTHRYQEAVRHYRQSLEYMPDEWRLYYQIAHLYGVLHREKEEKQFYEAFVKGVKDHGEEKNYEKLLESAEWRLKAIGTEEFFRGDKREK